VIVNQLLLNLFGHASQGVVSSLQLSLQSREGGGNFLLHLGVLGLGQAGVERVAFQRAAATDSGRNDELTLYSTFSFN